MKIAMIANKSLGNMVSWVFVLLCFGYPILTTLSAFINVSSTPINFVFKTILLSLSFLIIIVCLLSKQHMIAKLALPMLAFLFLYLLRVIWDTTIADIKVPYGLLSVYSYYIGCILVPVLAILLSFKYADIKKTIVRIFYILILDNILSLSCYLYLNNWKISFIKRAAIVQHQGNEILNPINFGIYGSCLLLVSICILLKYKGEVSKKTYNIAKIIWLLGLLNTIISNSRGPVASIIISLFFLGIIYFPTKETVAYYRKLLSCLGVAIILGVLVFTDLKSNNIEVGILKRVEAMRQNSNTGKPEARIMIYAECWEMFKSSPIIGKHFLTTSHENEGAYAHNIFLDILMSLGLLGLILYLMTLYNIYRKIRLARKYSTYLIFICLFLFFFCQAQFSGSTFNNVEKWNLIAVLFALKDRSNLYNPL